MKEYSQLICEMYCQDSKNEYSDYQDELLHFIFVLTLKAEDGDIPGLSESSYWPNLVRKLVSDLESPIPSIKGSAYDVIVNLSVFKNVPNMDQFLKTRMLQTISDELEKEKERASDLLIIISNFALSGEQFYFEILKTGDLIEKIMRIVSETIYNTNILEDALNAIYSVIKNKSNPFVLEYCVSRIEMWDILYTKISQNQSTECMVRILKIIKLLYRMGGEIQEKIGTEDNPFIQRVLDNNDLVEYLERAQLHEDSVVYKIASSIFDRYFLTE
jgi:hypothetical protein